MCFTSVSYVSGERSWRRRRADVCFICERSEELEKETCRRVCTKQERIVGLRRRKAMFQPGERKMRR
jgi:hypothetical protein